MCPTLCHPMNCSMPGLPVHHQLLEFNYVKSYIYIISLYSTAVQRGNCLSPHPVWPQHALSLKKRKFIISYGRKSCVPSTNCWLKRFPEEPVTKRSYPLSKSLVTLITLATTPLGLDRKVLRGPSPSPLHWFPAFTQGTNMMDFLSLVHPSHH